MSHNIVSTGVAVIIALIIGATGGFIVGEHQSKTPAAVSLKPAVTYEIKPYTGVGSGVLKSGTLLDLTGKDHYEAPGDIVGTIEAPGTWAMVRASE